MRSFDEVAGLVRVSEEMASTGGSRRARAAAGGFSWTSCA
jgi:hypothetical protein